MSTVRLENVNKYFGKLQVIKDFNLEIDDKEFIVFVGPSGCGKSTMLRTIAGLEDFQNGNIYIEDKLVNKVDPADRGVAMVFQSYALYPHMTVEENMGFGLKMTGTPVKEIRKQVAHAASILRLQELLHRKPKALSGGQRQRVAIGRAIVRNPKLFLFDEPLSNLDAELRVQMRVEIAKLHQAIDATMIYVTHDQVEAMTLADRIVVLRAGVIEQVGRPLELYDNPCNMFVAGFIGSPQMNFLHAKLIKKSKKKMQLHLESANKKIAFDVVSQYAENLSHVEEGDSVRLGIRPEHFLSDADSKKTNNTVKIKMQTEVVEHLGGSSFLYARSSSGESIVIGEHDFHSAVGKKQFVATFPLENAFVFANDETRLA